MWFDEGSMFGESGNFFERVNLACPTRLLEQVLANIETALVDRQ